MKTKTVNTFKRNEWTSVKMKFRWSFWMAISLGNGIKYSFTYTTIHLTEPSVRIGWILRLLFIYDVPHKQTNILFWHYCLCAFYMQKIKLSLQNVWMDQQTPSALPKFNKSIENVPFYAPFIPCTSIEDPFLSHIFNAATRKQHSFERTILIIIFESEEQENEEQWNQNEQQYQYERKTEKERKKTRVKNFVWAKIYNQNFQCV